MLLSILKEIEKILLSNSLTIRELHKKIKEITHDEFINCQTVDEIVQDRIYRIKYNYNDMNLEICFFINVIEYKKLDTVIKINNIAAWVN